MKNVIEYYYGLHLNDIRQVKGMYRFSVNGSDFIFLPYNRSLDELDDLCNLARNLLNLGLPVHQFVPNIDNSFLTLVQGNGNLTFMTQKGSTSEFADLTNNLRNNDNYYVMLRVYNKENRKITIDDIIHFSTLSYNKYNYKSLDRSNWNFLWGSKIDYFEYQINQFGKNKPMIRNSFSYYSGVVENGIVFFNLLDSIDTFGSNNEMLSIQHKRISINDDLLSFYNPLNMVVDYRIRDVCEYYKSKLELGGIYDTVNEYDNEISSISDDVLDFFKANSLNKNEIYLFYIRMLYPSFYFDKYEIDIISEEENSKTKFEGLEHLTSKYEELLRNLYMKLSKYLLMPDIWWISSLGNKKT